MKLRGEDLYCTVNTNITFKFVVDPPDKTAIWRRTTDELRDVGINAAGDGCSPPGLTSPPGYEYDCKTVNNTSVYILKFKSNSADDGIVYHLQGISPTQSITYKPYTSNTGALSHTNCRNTENFDVLVCKVYCNCIKSSLSWKYITQNQTETSFTIMDNDPIPCGTGVENFYKLDINVTKDVIEEVLEKKKLTGQVNVTGTLTIGDENYYFTTTLNTNDSMTSPEPTTTVTSSSRFSSDTTPQTSSSRSSSSTNQTLSLTSTTPASQSSSQHTESSSSGSSYSSSTVTITSSTDTSPSPELLTSTELIIIVVCSCVSVLILVVVVICCVVLSIRRNKRRRDSLHNNNHSMAMFNPHTRNPYHQTTSYPKKGKQKTTSSMSDSRQYIPSDGRPGEAPRSNLPDYKNHGYVMDNPLYTHDDVYTLDRIHEVPRRNNRVKYITYDNVYNHRPSRRDDYRHHTEQPYIRPDRMYYQPYQYYYHH